MSTNGKIAPPRDGLVRALAPGLELRAGDGTDDMPTLIGHFAVFDTFTEIDSLFEGRFLERIAPGAFKKTMKEQRNDIKVLFQHGHDPQIGDKPLGPIDALREDERGAYYEVPLVDASYTRDLIPGIEAGLYGASFRFRVIKDEYDEEPEESASNPHGLPERTITELRLFEFGPVTFPAYADATAGLRSLTDERTFGQLLREFPKRMHDLLEYNTSVRDRTADGLERAEAEPHSEEQRALSNAEAEAEPHSDHGSRDQSLYGLSAGKETPQWRL